MLGLCSTPGPEWTSFFVLSGFLIAGILLDHRKSSNYFQVFYLRRVCRIFPLYYLVLGLFICFSATAMSTSPAFAWLFAKPMPIWSYATFTQNFFMGHRGFFGAQWLGVTWSVAVEEQFYLFVPLLIYLLPRRSLFCVLLAGVLAAPLLRQLYPPLQAYVITPFRADDLLSGACLALLVRSHSFIDTVRRHHRSLLVLLLLLAAGAGALTWWHTRLDGLDPVLVRGSLYRFRSHRFCGHTTSHRACASIPAARVVRSALLWLLYVSRNR